MPPSAVYRGGPGDVEVAGEIEHGARLQAAAGRMGVPPTPFPAAAPSAQVVVCWAPGSQCFVGPAR